MSLKISVITPSYNQAAFLEETIKSVINQSYSNCEYIIIDGGSSDSSTDIIKKYSNFLAYWISERDKGQADAINKGLMRATGDIVCWLNSDDLLEPNALNIVAEFFRENGRANFVYGDGIMFQHDGNKRSVFCRPGIVTREVLARCDPLQQPSTFWRKSIHSEIGYINENLHYILDWDFFMRVALRYEMYYLPVTLSRYRLHQTHKTGSGSELRSREVLDFVDKYGREPYKSMFSTLFPHAREIRALRDKFGWRLGRVVFYAKYPSVFLRYRGELSVGMNMY